MQTYIPSALELWTRPGSYMGAEWPNHYVFLGRHRDSDLLTESNFECAMARLREIPEPENWTHDDAPVQAVSESHWAVGWVEWIAIHKDASEHLKAADEMQASLENYPVLNESDWSEREDSEAQRVWKDCYNGKERLEYVRNHRSQFDFRDFSDLLGCIRGKYFCGYASELIA